MKNIENIAIGILLIILMSIIIEPMVETANILRENTLDLHLAPLSCS